MPETYIHRIGRTGREGNTGVAIAFCDNEEKTDLRDIEKLIGRKIYVIEKHPFPLIPGLDTPKKQRTGASRDTGMSRRNGR